MLTKQNTNYCSVIIHQEINTYVPMANSIYTVSQKNSPFYFCDILSDIVQFCQFLEGTYHREFETKLFTPPKTSRFICSYCTL